MNFELADAGKRGDAAVMASGAGAADRDDRIGTAVEERALERTDALELHPPDFRDTAVGFDRARQQRRDPIVDRIDHRVGADEAQTRLAHRDARHAGRPQDGQIDGA